MRPPEEDVIIRVASLASSALVLLASLAPAGARAGNVLLDELHYVTTYHDQVIGTRVVRVHQAEYEGGPAVLTATEDVTRITARGVTTRTVTEREEVTDTEGNAIELRERRTESGQVVHLCIRVTEEDVLFETIIARVRRKVRAERKGPGGSTTSSGRRGRILFDLDGAAFVRAGRLHVGERVRAYVIARVELGIAELEAEVLEEAELPETPGLEFPSPTGYRIRVSNVNGVGEPWEIVSDSLGRTVELAIGPMRVSRVAREGARLPRRAVVLENRIPTRRLSDLESVESMTVDAGVAEDVRDDIFPETSYVTPRRTGPGGIRLVLREVRPDGRIPREELSEEDRRRFTSPSPLAESDSPKVRALAERVAGEEPEPLVRCLLLTRWVHRTLSKSSRGPAQASALETLRARAGDCTEHSVLVVALARALGIPARQALGFVHDGKGFQFHAWAEAHVEDRWVPLDPTLGRVGVPGIYVLLGREGDLVEYHSRANSLQGRTTMEIVAVGPSAEP